MAGGRDLLPKSVQQKATERRAAGRAVPRDGVAGIESRLERRILYLLRIIPIETTDTPARLTTAQPATVPAVHFVSLDSHSSTLILNCPSAVPVTLSELGSTEPSGSTVMEAVTDTPGTASNGAFGGRARFTA